MITFQIIGLSFVLVYACDVILTHYARVKLLTLKQKQLQNKSYLSTSKTKNQDDKNKSPRGR
jgi:hypothetical protein